MARKPGKPKRFECHISTTDQWYPNYPDDTVRVCVMDCTNIWGQLAIRTSVWGDDDYGMERDEYFTTHRDKNKAYKARCKEVQSWQCVTKDNLKKLGFVRA